MKIVQYLEALFFPAKGKGKGGLVPAAGAGF